MPLKVKSKFWIVDEEGSPVFGQGRKIILTKIEELGSIKAAAESLKMSYRAVWGKIRTAEERLGFKLVTTTPGGGKGRGTKLTKEAMELLALFEELQEKGNSQADNLFLKLLNNQGKTKKGKGRKKS